MAISVITRDFARRPLLLGTCAGLVLTIAIAVFAPAADMKAGDSRIAMSVAGAIFLVPGCIVTAYACRFVFRNIRQLPVLRFIWAGAALFFTLAVTISACNERSVARRFAYEGRSAEGTVIETHPEDHDRLLVAYKVSGTVYRTLSAGPRVARNYKPGEPVRVYYFVSAPANGFCIEPRWRPDLLVALWVLAAGVLPLWMIALWGSIDLRRRQTRSNKSSVQPGRCSA